MANLFTLDGYNITSYISDYLQEMQGRYYTQRWYIYWRDSGSEQVCSYAPPTDSESIMYGGEWYRVGTSDANYQYTAADYENSLRNSESYAGWSRARCQELNSSDSKYHYAFYNYMSSSRIYKSKSGRTTAFSYAHYIDVYKTWNVYEEVYEETFDSQYDAEQAMQAKFNAKLAELNDNEEGRVYRIGKDRKNYYQAADEVSATTRLNLVKEISHGRKTAISAMPSTKIPSAMLWRQRSQAVPTHQSWTRALVHGVAR